MSILFAIIKIILSLALILFFAFLIIVTAAVTCEFIIDKRIEENNQKLTDEIFDKIRKEFKNSTK